MADTRAATAEGMRRLCHWAAEAARKPLPPEVRRRAALVLADDLAAMVAAAPEPQVAAAHASIARSAGAAEATVFAPGVPRLDRCSAAAANGMAVTWCELDEGYRRAPCHAGAYTLPALLAEAEARALPVARVLSCLAAAYEVAARLSRAFPFPAIRVHPHAAFASVGAAAGAGLARGQDGATLLGAVSGAASMAFAGPFRHAMDGALVRTTPSPRRSGPTWRLTRWPRA